MDKEKEKSEWITYLWTFASYQIFTTVRENIISKSDEHWERYAVMNDWMFHKQNHICKSRTDLRRKLEHNKKAKKLCQIFNREYK